MVGSRRALDKLWADAPPPGAALEAARLATLPEPAQQYLEHAIAPGTPLTSAVRLRIHGEIKLRRWLPFAAEQVIRSDRGMIWNATVRMRGVPIVGFDRLLDGEGAMQWKLLGIVPIMAASGPDISRSAAGAFWMSRLPPKSSITQTGLCGNGLQPLGSPPQGIPLARCTHSQVPRDAPASKKGTAEGWPYTGLGCEGPPPYTGIRLQMRVGGAPHRPAGPARLRKIVSQTDESFRPRLRLAAVGGGYASRRASCFIPVDNIPLQGGSHEVSFEQAVPPFYLDRLLVGATALGFDPLQLALDSAADERFRAIRAAIGKEKAMDAYHLRCAEHASCDYFLTTDKRLVNSIRNQRHLKVVTLPIFPSELADLLA